MPAPRIESYRFGRIKVDGQVYGRDLLLTPDEVVSGWWRAEGHSLTADDLAKALVAKPQVLVIGTGSFDRMRVPDETREYLRASGIEVIAQPTGAACETYNRLCNVQRVVAALHLTC